MEEVRRGRDERAHLEQRVKEAERLESLGVLAGGVAHDFNNLLVPIVAGAELLREDCPDEDTQRTADDILQAAGIATDLCQQMLSYAGRTPVRLEALALDSLIDDMRELVRASTQGMAVRFELGPTPGGLRADPTQVRQVLLNLVLNASEACGAEGGRVVLRTGEQRPGETRAEALVIGELDATASYAYLEVEDNGPGMEAEVLERVFDPFFSTKLLGRGLGMAVVFGIVRRHEGVVCVTSEPGRGTKIRVLFPLAPQEAEAREPVAPRAALPAVRGRVLLVDDDPRVRATTGRMLERKGFEVVAVADGKGALALCREIGHELTCVLLDLSMPGMTGDHVYRALREKLPFLPIVLMSGYTGERVAELLQGDPRALFLHKPFGSEALLGAIGRASAEVECTGS
ncbi:MAG: hypothetical protein CL910_19110 [Deltaproteobacteria bacterium]|jgi:nitrogen-specific signal transduction histidine kinase/CheY-like chemotaxis protein|nr:hypothetical protein [Deltaproteobacteria bacterium]